MRINITCLITFFVIMYNFSSFSQMNFSLKLDDASKSSTLWLDNINNNKFSKAFESLSLNLKSIFDSLEWISGMNDVIKPFGELKNRVEYSREFISDWSKTEYEMMYEYPNGYYAIFKYHVYYEFTHNHTENLILHQDDNKRWRVLDYGYEYTEAKGYKEYTLPN